MPAGAPARHRAPRHGAHPPLPEPPPDASYPYGPPPGGGRISARQGGAYKVGNGVPTVPTSPSIRTHSWLGV